jgi:hypothetical protein
MSGTGSYAGDPVLRNANGYFYLLTSSERFKDSIIRSWKNPQFLDFLKIDPIQFRYKIDHTDNKPSPEDKVAPDMVGFSAEEIHASGLPGMLNYDNDLLPSSLRDHGILVYHHLILQDLNTRLEKLEKK